MIDKYTPHVNEKVVTEAFLSGPGQFLVKKLLAQMAKVPGLISIFGKYEVVKANDETAAASQKIRWADYARFDWSVRSLPAICVYESDTESKESANAWLTGAVNIQVFWPPNLRRSDLTRVPSAFRGAILNFFESALVTAMLDEHPSALRDEKVPGLNELGKSLTWSPNVEGILEGELVPVTMISVRYRIDLRSWYRFLDLDGRTKDDPFQRTLDDATEVDAVYQGTGFSPGDIQIEIKDRFVLNQ